MASIALTAQKREQFGRQAKELRASGSIPAELYGRGVENAHLAVTKKDFIKTLKTAGESTIVELVVDGKKHPVLIHDVMRDPISDEIINVDFYQVRLDEKIRVKVPLEFVGESAGVKEKSGILVKALSEIEVEALPMDLPKELTVDLAQLTDIGSSFAVKNLTVPANVRLLAEPEFVIATVTARMTEEQEAALAAKGADVAEVKTEGEEKKEAKAAAEAATGAAEGAEAPAK